MSTNLDLTEASSLLAEAATGNLENPIAETIEAIAGAFGAGKPVLMYGNDGSAADAMHIAGELVGRYLLERPGYKAIALGTDPAVTTAWSNDYDYASLFARQVEALGEAGGALWGLRKSGNQRMWSEQ